MSENVRFSSRHAVLLAALTVAVVAWPSIAYPGAPERDAAPATAGARRLGSAAHDFDFLVGHWKVHHRVLKARLAGSTEWEDFDGTLVNWPTLDGMGNVSDNVFNSPRGTYRGLGIRALDVKAGLWASWWLDARHTAIDPPMRGSFKDGIGDFVADDSLNGKPIKVRVRWSRITRTSAHWEQAFSPDGGKTWEINWISDFTRTQ